MTSTDAGATRLEQALLAFQQGHKEEAIAQLRDICAAEPDNAAAWFHCGEFLLDLERAEEAEAPLLRATELTPEEFQPVLHLAQARLLLGKVKEAVTGYERAVKLGPDSADAWVNLALARYNTGQFAESARAFEKGFALQSDLANKPGLMRYHALALSEAGEMADAVPALDRALAALPEADARHRPALLLGKGAALNELGKFADAHGALQMAATLPAKDGERALILMQLAAAQEQLREFTLALDSLDRALALPSNPASTGRMRVQRAGTLNALGRPAEAEQDAAAAAEILAAVEAMAPWRWLACFQRTVALNALSRFAEVVDVSEGAASGFPTLGLPGELLGQMNFFRGIALRAVGRVSEAVAALAAALESMRGGGLGEACSFQLGLTLNQAGDHAGALRAFAQTLEIQRERGSGTIAPGAILVQQVLTLVVLKQADEAVTLVDAAIQSAREPAAAIAAWKLKADVLSEIGRGVELLSPPPPILEGHPFVLAVQGSMLALNQRLAEAMEKFRAVTWPIPDVLQPQALAWLGAGMALLGLLRGVDASEAFAKACELDPQQKTPVLALLRGQALIVAGHHQEALAVLADAPEQAMTWAMRGVAHGALKQVDAALRALARAAELVPATDRTSAAVLVRVIARSNQGFLLLGEKRLDEALQAFVAVATDAGQLAEADPNRMLSLVGHGLTLLATNRGSEAEPILRDAARLSTKVPAGFPRREIACCALGALLLMLDRDDEAVCAFDRALAIEPRSADAVAGRAQAYLAAEDYGAAERDFQRAAELAGSDEDRIAARIGRGQALLGLELLEQAVIELRQAVPLLAADSRMAGRLWLRLSEAYRKLGRLDAAHRVLRRGLAVEKSRATAVRLARGLSAVLLEMQRPAEVRDFIVKECGWLSPDPALDYNLGIAHHRLKDGAEAARVWKRAAEAGLDRAREVVDTLDRGVRPTTGWIDFWWGEGRGWLRHIIGATLATTLVAVALLPLIKADAIAGWLNTGQSWEMVGTTVAVLVGLLLAPSLNRLTFASVDLELNPSGFEGSDPEAELEALLEKLPAIGTTSLANAALSGGAEPGRGSSVAAGGTLPAADDGQVRVVAVAAGVASQPGRGS